MLRAKNIHELLIFALSRFSFAAYRQQLASSSTLDDAGSELYVNNNLPTNAPSKEDIMTYPL